MNAHDDDVYRFHLEGATTRPNANDLTGSYKPSALSHATVQCPLPAVYSTDPENPSPPHLGWLCEQPAEASSSLTSANISGTPIGRDGSKPLSRSVHISSNTEQAGMGTLLPSKLDSAFSLRAKASRPKRAPANDASGKG